MLFLCASAARFGVEVVLSEEEKKKLRAQKFGIVEAKPAAPKGAAAAPKAAPNSADKKRKPEPIAAHVPTPV